MINTNNLAPWNWGPDITLREHYAIVDNRAIADRYNRGIWIFRDLLATPWYRLATRRAYKTQLRNLRGEYRELLKSWVADHRPRRPSPLPPRRAQTAMPERAFEVPAITTLNDPGPYDVMRDEYHVDIVRDEPAPTRIDPLPTPATFVGHGGSFGGAGASASWDAPSACDTGSSTPDSGGGGGCDGGSSPSD